MTSEYPVEWDGHSAAYILDDILEGADFTDPPEGTALTDAQAYGRILRMGHDERMKFMAMMRQSAEQANLCFAHGHEQLIDRIRYVQDQYRLVNAAFTAQTTVALHFERRMRFFMLNAHNWRNFARNLTAWLDGNHEEETPLRPIETPR